MRHLKRLKRGDYFPSGMRWWLLVVAVVQVITGVCMLVFPELLKSQAYDVAFDMLPIYVWGWLALLVGVAAEVARLVRSWVLAVFALGVFMWSQFIFGLSIFALTWQGVDSAIVGSVQWWMSAVVSAWFISRGNNGK